MTTVDELNHKRKTVAKYGLETLTLMTVPALKKLASGIVPGIAGMKKADLISNLIKATQTDRALIALIPDTPVDDILEHKSNTNVVAENVHEDLADWTHKLYQDFIFVVQANYKDGVFEPKIHGDIAALGYRVIRFLDNRSGDAADGGLAFTTKLRYRTHICNLLHSLVSSEAGTPYFKQLESCLVLLNRQIKFQISDITSQKKGLQEQRLANRKKEKETIRFSPIYDFAINVFHYLDRLKHPDWKKVSIALAIVTGRRMAEIHITQTQFEYIEHYQIAFTGQLKVKGDALEYFSAHPSYHIPVLVHAELVCQAHEWLKHNHKTVADSRIAASRYTKDLSAAMKILRQRFGVEHNFFTYKGLRSIYAQVCNFYFNHNDPDNTLYLAQILGHGRGELLRADSLTDMLTPQSYNSDFRVVDLPVSLK